MHVLMSRSYAKDTMSAAMRSEATRNLPVTATLEHKCSKVYASNCFKNLEHTYPR